MCVTFEFENEKDRFNTKYNQVYLSADNEN